MATYINKFLIVFSFFIPSIGFAQVLTPAYPSVQLSPLIVVLSEITETRDCIAMRPTSLVYGYEYVRQNYDNSGQASFLMPTLMDDIFIVDIQLYDIDVTDCLDSDVDNNAVQYSFQIPTGGYVYSIFPGGSFSGESSTNQGIQTETYATTLFVSALAMLLYFFVFTVRAFVKGKNKRPGGR